MDSVDEGYTFSQTASAFGPTEFANALANNKNAHGTKAEKLLSNHGLINRYQRLSQEKFGLIKIL